MSIDSASRPKSNLFHPSSQHHGIKTGWRPTSLEQKMIPRGVRVSNRGWWEKGQIPHVSYVSRARMAIGKGVSNVQHNWAVWQTKNTVL